MIKLTRINHEPIVANLATILYLESVPETTVVFSNGDRVLVAESIEQVRALALEYLQEVHAGRLVQRQREQE